MAVDEHALERLRRAADALSGQDGRGLSRELVVELGSAGGVMSVRREHDHVLAIMRPAAGASSGFADLTPREREVAALIAEGRTNREIAETLVISVATAKDHVHSILQKAHLRSRAAVAAAWHGDH